MTMISRRRFLGLLGTGAAGTVLVACGPDSENASKSNPDKAVYTLAPLSGTPMPPVEPTAEGGSPEASPVAGGGGGNDTLKAVESIKYDKKEITLAPGGKLSFTNETALPHDVVIEELDNLQLIPVVEANGSAEGTLPADTKPGKYTFYCSEPGHRAAGMEGTLTVVEAGAASEAPAEEKPKEEEKPAEGEGGGDGNDTLAAVDSIKYDKKEIKLKPGGKLSFKNDTALPHDVVIEELDDLELIPVIDPNSSAEGTLPEDTKPGEYTFYCSEPGHRAAGMEGKLIVE